MFHFIVSFVLSYTDAPVFDSCPIRQNITTDSEQQSAVANWTNPTATDNTGAVPEVNCYPESGSVFSVGSTNVICYANSINGRVATCSFEVTVTGT